MILIPYVGVLAQNELWALRDILAEGSEPKLEAWITRQAHRRPTRERPFLAYLALLVAENLARTVPQAEFFHVRLDDASPARSMSARLITATMNDDLATVDALALTAEAWTPAERRDVVAELIAVLRRVIR